MTSLSGRIYNRLSGIVLNLIQMTERVKVGDLVYLHSEGFKTNADYARVYQVIEVNKPTSILKGDNYAFKVALYQRNKDINSYQLSFDIREDGLFKIREPIPQMRYKVNDFVTAKHHGISKVMKVCLHPELWYDCKTGKTSFHYGLSNSSINTDFHFSKMPEEAISPYVAPFNVWNKLNG